MERSPPPRGWPRTCDRAAACSTYDLRLMTYDLHTVARQQDRLPPERGEERAPEVGFRLLSNELGALEQRVEEGGHLGPALGARAIVILAPHDDPAQHTLRRIVVDRDPWILKETDKPAPDPRHVGDSLAERALAQGRGRFRP